MIKSLPACFFPTKVLLVDDDIKFLTELTHTLNTRTATYQISTDSKEALSYIQNKYELDLYLNTWFEDKHHKVEDQDYAYRHQIYLAERFNQISTVVSDYDMPGMNGVEFLSHIENPYVRKIILTGEADESIAVNAFNEGLIHGFIRKSDPQALERLTAMIRKSQIEFFQILTTRFIEAVKEDAPTSLLDFPSYIDIFADVLKQGNIVEYYLLDSIGKFLLLDAYGNLSAIYAYNNNEQNIYASYLPADAYFLKDQEFIFPETPESPVQFLKDQKTVGRINGREETPYHDFPIYSIPGQEESVWGYIPKLINCKPIISFDTYKNQLDKLKTQSK